MQFPEVSRIINVLGDRFEISTYEANEYHPGLTSQEMASILRRDERIMNTGKKWFWMGCNRWLNISMWRVVD